MKLFAFAIASIVDANTGFGLDHGGGKLDYGAAERHAREIRGKSVIAVIAAIRDGISAAAARVEARAEERREVNRLLALNDHLLRDIGLSREDLLAVRYGATSLTRLDAERGTSRQTVKRESPVAVEAANQEIYALAKCA